jgi:hypothetical protein
MAGLNQYYPGGAVEQCWDAIQAGAVAGGPGPTGPTGAASGGGGTGAGGTGPTGSGSAFVGRALLTTNASYTVDAVLGVDAPGAGPFNTLQYAWNYLSGALDLGQSSLQITCVGAGPYSLFAVNGWIGGSGVYLYGSGSGTTTGYNFCYGTPDGNTQVPFAMGAPLFIDSINLVDNGVGVCLETFCPAGVINIGTWVGDVLFTGNTSSGGPTFCAVGIGNAGATVNVFEATFTGTFLWGIAATQGSFGQIYGGVTMSGAPSFAGAFLFAEDIGQIYLGSAGVSFSGAATATLGALAVKGSVIDLQAVALSSLPGGGGGLCDLTSCFNMVTDLIEVPTSGGTVTVAPQNSIVVLNPSSALTSLTVALPSMSILTLAPSFSNYTIQGPRIAFSNVSSYNIAGLTFSGGTVIGAPSTFPAGTVFALTYNVSASTWYLTG